MTNSTLFYFRIERKLKKKKLILANEQAINSGVHAAVPDRSVRLMICPKNFKRARRLCRKKFGAVRQLLDFNRLSVCNTSCPTPIWAVSIVV
jgi:hypothetical protein